MGNREGRRDSRELGRMLIGAIESGNASKALDLIGQGASLDERQAFGVAALHRAAAFAPNLVAALVLAGAKIEDRDEDGWTPLRWAAEYQNEDGLREMIKAGADLESRCEAEGETPLHAAAGLGSEDGMVLALLEAGADPDARNFAGKAPWQIAEDSGRGERASRMRSFEISLREKAELDANAPGNEATSRRKASL